MESVTYSRTVVVSMLTPLSPASFTAVMKPMPTSWAKI